MSFPTFLCSGSSFNLSSLCENLGEVFEISKFSQEGLKIALVSKSWHFMKVLYRCLEGKVLCVGPPKSSCGNEVLSP